VATVARAAVAAVAHPIRWMADERGALALAGGRHRVVMQNGHLLLSVFWLACGFIIAQCFAVWNARAIEARTIYV
jgi:hypothetical protein